MQIVLNAIFVIKLQNHKKMVANCKYPELAKTQSKSINIHKISI